MGSDHQLDEDDVKLPASSKRIMCWAGIFSGVWLIAAIIIAWSFHCGSHAPVKINEWADYAAGASAPLAFLWLVVAVFLQSRELREQRQELAWTRKEFKHNRSVMQEQANEAKNQAAYILKQTTILEKNETNAEAERIFNDMLENIATRLRQYVSSAWNIVHVVDWDNGQPLGSVLNIRKSMYEGEDDVLVIASTVQVLRTRLRDLSQEDPNPELKALNPYDFQRVYRAVISGSQNIADLPDRFREKAATLELDELKDHMTFIADHAGIKPFEPISQVSKV